MSVQQSVTPSQLLPSDVSKFVDILCRKDKLSPYDLSKLRNFLDSEESDDTDGEESDYIASKDMCKLMLDDKWDDYYNPEGCLYFPNKGISMFIFCGQDKTTDSCFCERHENLKNKHMLEIKYFNTLEVKLFCMRSRIKYACQIMSRPIPSMESLSPYNC